MKIFVITVKKRKTEGVWACHKVNRTCQNNPAGNSARKEKEGKTEKAMQDNITERTGKTLSDNQSGAGDRER